MSKISVLTVNLNNLEGLKKTAKSIASQTYNNFEYLIIDGGSTDRSKAYIEGLSPNLTTWISETDTGIYDTMNKGIKLAKGDYVYFLNSGDVRYEVSTLAQVPKKMDDNHDLYYGSLIYNWPKRIETVNFPSQLSYQFFLVDNINHQACFIKRSLFDELFLYNEEYKIISD